MGRKALTAHRADSTRKPPAPGQAGRRRRLIKPCQGDRDYVRAVEQLIADAARARSFGAKGFR